MNKENMLSPFCEIYDDADIFHWDVTGHFLQVDTLKEGGML